MKPVIKIFVSYHKDCEIISNDIIKPIQVGTAKNNVSLDMLHDNTGDNISSKNDLYCELTAQYWAWKNVEADYYGFMHYRRQFIFRDKEIGTDLSEILECNYITSEYKKETGLNEKDILTAINGYDIIIPKPINSLSAGMLNNELQYAASSDLITSDFELMCDVAASMFPEYERDIDEFRQSDEALYCNMFVFGKVYFLDYCEWLFAILFEVEKKLDFTKRTSEQTRVMGHLSERLLNIYIKHLIRVKPEVKVRNLQMTFIKNPVDIVPIEPIYDEKAVCIALASNESYMPYVGVMLSSLLAHADSERDYDIVIMISDESNPNLVKHKKRIQDAITGQANITIRFVDMSSKIAGLNLSLPAHLTIETYFRLFLPQLLPNHKKILYLDADMIVCADVSKLYDTDLKGSVIGAAHDPIFVSSEISPSFNKREYALETGLNHHDYFQAGVLLIDLEKLGNGDLCAKMLDYAGSHETEFADQDVLNIYLRGKVHYIDLRWNVEITPQIDELIEYCPAALKNQYLEARKKAYIYHFAGVDKPWKMPTMEYAEKFWQIARRTPWYEEILLNMLQSAIFSIPARDWEYSLKITDDLFLGLKKAHAELSELGRASDFTKTFAKELEALSEDTKLIYDTPHIYFYGAGVKGKELLNYFANLDIRMPDIIWDRAAKPNQTLRSIPVVVPDFDNLSKISDTLFIIAIESKSITDKVIAQFKEKDFNNIMTYKKAVNVFSRELWLKMEKKP